VDGQCNKLVTVISQTKLTEFATIEVPEQKKTEKSAVCAIVQQ